MNVSMNESDFEKRLVINRQLIHILSQYINDTYLIHALNYDNYVALRRYNEGEIKSITGLKRVIARNIRCYLNVVGNSEAATEELILMYFGVVRQLL